MKTLGKIKLNQFSKAELEQRQLNALKGGCGCETEPCPCDYLQNQGSGTIITNQVYLNDGGHHYTY